MSIGESILSYSLVMSFAYIMGWILRWLNNYQVKRAIRLKKEGKKAGVSLMIADLTGLMIGGLIMRNLPFLSSIMSHYPSTFHSYTASGATAIVLLRIGMALRLDQNVGIVLMIVLIPYFSEMTAYALLFPSFNSSITTIGAIALAALMPPVGAAALSQNQIQFINDKRGLDKLMPQILITACALENILSILLFGILSEVYFASSNPSDTNLGLQVMIQIGLNVGGVVLGVLCTVLFNIMRRSCLKDRSGLYALYLIATCVAIICICKYLQVLNIAFTGIISFASLSNSYVLNKNMTVSAKVNNQIRKYNDILKTFLFGGVGASLQIDQLLNSHVESAVAMMFLCSIVRFIAGYLMFFKTKKFDYKDKLYLNSSWYPKGAIQAAFASHVLDYAKANQVPALIEVGTFVVTLNSLLLLITIPIGSMLSLNFGDQWLSSENHQQYSKVTNTNQIQQQEEDQPTEKQISSQ